MSVRPSVVTITVAGVSQERARAYIAVGALGSLAPVMAGLGLTCISVVAVATVAVMDRKHLVLTLRTTHHVDSWQSSK